MNAELKTLFFMYKTIIDNALRISGQDINICGTNIYTYLCLNLYQQLLVLILKIWLKNLQCLS